jgi:hypothetical protein
MKKILFIFSVWLYIGGARAQTASVPDSSMLKCLKSAFARTIDSNNRLIIAKAGNAQGTLQCINQGITNAEGLQYFTGLSQVVLNDNAISSLPDLSSMKSLAWLDLSNNQLSQIPNLNKLTSLQGLFIAMNKFALLPRLDSLKNLTALDASLNNISQFPVLPKINQIQTLNLNDNQLSTLPDTIYLGKLRKMWLYDNGLTFSELSKLSTLKNYDTIFVSPQSPVLVGKAIASKEQARLQLSTGVDVGVPGMVYEWYKNGSLIGSVGNDTLFIPSLSFQDSGKYVCRLKNAMFPKLVLHTDTFYLQIASCFDLKAFSVSTTSISCNKTGSITVKNTSGQSMTYFLRSTFSGTMVTSDVGYFAGLAEPSYTLKIKSSSGCEKNYPGDIVIPKDECKQVLITPNGDGETDTYFFTQSGKVTIYDKRGAVVKTMQIPGEWDGSSKSGKVVPAYYLADINNGEELINISVVY